MRGLAAARVAAAHGMLGQVRTVCECIAALQRCCTMATPPYEVWTVDLQGQDGSLDEFQHVLLRVMAGLPVFVLLVQVSLSCNI